MKVVTDEYISAFEYLSIDSSDDYVTELIVLSKTKTATGFNVVTAKRRIEAW